MTITYHGEAFDCPDCDDAGLDTHDKPCDHGYIKSQLAWRLNLDRPLTSRKHVPRARWTDCYGDPHATEYQR